MTDTAGRGGVGIRLYVNGDDTVKRAFNGVGDSGRKMWAQIATGQQTVNPAFRALSAGVTGVRSEIDTFAGRTGIAGSALGAFGAVGLAASVALAGVAVAVAKAREAMAFADEIDDAANKLDIGTTALQQYRYAMIAVGGSAEDADRAIGSFTAKLGEAQAGGRALQWFERLGFTREQLAGYDTAEEALGDVMDRLAGLNKETERAAAASKIGLEPMIALAREGRDGVEALMQAALDLGYVLDEELVKQGGAANQKFEEMSTIIDIQMKSAFISLGPVILELTAFLVDMAKGVADVADSWRALEDRSTQGLRRQDQRLAGEQMRLLEGQNGPGDLQGYARMQFDGINIQRRNIAAQLQERAQEDPEPRTDRAGLIDRPTRSRASGGASRAAGDAERRQRERDQAVNVLHRQELEALRAAIQARFGPGGTEESALDLARANITIEVEAQDAAREALRAQLEKSGALDDEAKLRLEELRIAQGELAKVRDGQALAERTRQLAAERLDEEEDAERHAIDLLDIQAEMVGTARERYEIGRRILLAEQALERKLLEAEVDADGTRTTREQARLDRMSIRQGAETDLYDAQEVERQRQDFYSYGREVVQAIEDGRIGEMIGDRIKERLLDGALAALFDMTKGGGGEKSGGGFLSSLVNFGLNMFSSGNPAAGLSKLPQKKGGKFAGGGFVSGPGGPRDDRIPAMLSNGEYVVNAKTTSLMRPLLDHINNGYVPGYANGGLVGNPATPEAGPPELGIS